MNKRRFAVFGSPIIHSFSPQIYHQLFINNKVDWKYNRILANNSKDVIKFIKEFKLYGCNITSPLKSSVIPYLSNMTPDAKKINAVNTILNCNDKLFGFNTDWKGVLNSFQNYYSKKNKKYNLNEKKILLIGAGNSASAVIYGIKTFFPKSNIDVINRNINSAKKLIKIYNSNYLTDKINSISLDQYDIIIITIPTPSEYLSEIKFPEKTILLFSNYTDLDYFEKIKKRDNCIIGNEWLKEQAISAFEYYYDYNEYNKKITLTSLQISKELNKLKNKTIFLTGFSGAGKTFIGEKIAKHLNRPFFDLDKMV
jgi:shikimate dehydrogenase